MSIKFKRFIRNAAIIVLQLIMFLLMVMSFSMLFLLVNHARLLP